MTRHAQGPAGSPWEDLPRPVSALLPHRTFVWFIVGGVGVVALLAALAERLLLTIDEPVASGVRRPQGLETFFRWVTLAGSQRTGLVIALVVAVLIYRRCPTMARALPLAVVSGIAADVTVKVIIDRPRPAESLTGTALGSFPSGHVIHSVVFLGLMPSVAFLVSGSRRAWVAAWAAVLAVIFGVALSRIYLGAHWPSDVLAGLVVGSAVLVAIDTYLARNPCDGCRLHPVTGREGPDTISL